MEPSPKLRLERLFQLQDEVLEEHLTSSKYLERTFQFLSDCTWLNARMLTTMRFESQKQTAIRSLAVDSLSHTIVAIRLGLWGDLPESLTLLRSAIESAAQLQYVTKNRLYEIAVYEMDRKFEQVSFERSVSGLGELGKRITKIHGKLSDVAVHSTASRLALGWYEYQGEPYDRVGFARNVNNAELALFYCMDACMMLTEAFLWAYEQDNLAFTWVNELNDLSDRFRSIQRELLNRFATLDRGRWTRRLARRAPTSQRGGTLNG